MTLRMKFGDVKGGIRWKKSSEGGRGARNTTMGLGAAEETGLKKFGARVFKIERNRAAARKIKFDPWQTVRRVLSPRIIIGVGGRPSVYREGRGTGWKGRGHK